MPASTTESVDGQQEEEEEQPGSPTSPGMPDYEKERQAIMARNREKMKMLGLQQLAADVMPKAKPKPRTQAKGLASRKKKVRIPSQSEMARVEAMSHIFGIDYGGQAVMSDHGRCKELMCSASCQCHHFKARKAYDSP